MKKDAILLKGVLSGSREYSSLFWVRVLYSYVGMSNKGKRMGRVGQSSCGSCQLKHPAAAREHRIARALAHRRGGGGVHPAQSP